MKPVMLSSTLRLGDNPGGGAVAGHASPPALSPNLPSIVKMEPRLPSPYGGDGESPCDGLNGADSNTGGPGSDGMGGEVFSPRVKRQRHDDGTWIPSPSQMSMSSLSPPPSHLVNGMIMHHQQNSNANGGSSPISGYDPYSPKGKDDMSPLSSGSMNGCFNIDSFGDPKKKKGPAPRQQEELCLVCGDRASGYHYNALTCEGCKGFFRRSITKNAVYQCKYGNNCEIDMYMRRKCQECRLKKCLTVGMRPECVVPEYQCAIKRECKRAQKDKDRPNSTTKEGSIEKEDIKPIVGIPHAGGPNLGGGSGIKPLTTVQEDLINRLVYYQEQFESPSEEDVKKITEFPLGTTDEDHQKRFQHITEITILTVQLIVEFSKRVPGFDTLLREDQITLLKACSSEVMMLRTARKYDIKTDSIVFANNQPYTRENYHSASMGESAEALFPFCRNLCLLKVDNAEYALLTATVIFSERPALMEPKKVEKIQEYYIDTLKAYVDNHRPPNKNYFARLLGILTELRSLGNINSEQCFSLKVQNKKLPAFLEEIWDIQV